MTRVLVVEDDERLRTAMVLALRDDGYQVSSAVSLAEARVHVRGDGRSVPELMVLDVRLGPRESGIDLVRELAGEDRMPPTVVVSGEATIGETVEALRLGVFDFLEKPVSRERLLQTLRNALEQQRLKRRVGDLETRLDAGRDLLGASASVRTLREQIARVAATEARVLILGESGTGKELVAEQIHARSARCDRPFVKLNCAAIPATLIEAELFGHARGAFTDARTARGGLFEEADGGTLFLDEIGDMDLAMQTRLLRVLEDGRVRRLGESQERTVDVRVLAATHRDLEGAARDGRFRQDLYFRVAHIPLAVPALRDRLEDVPLLFRHFVAAASARHRMRPKEIGEDVFPPLLEYSWPGNVRELRNIAERLVVLGSDPLRAEELPADVFRKGRVEESGWLRTTRITGEGIVAFKDFKTESEREYVEAVLQRCSWNVAAAARALGMPRTYLHAKVVALGIARPDRPLGESE
jgi:two-component system nitrogen regulation response regulator NtrX